MLDPKKDNYRTVPAFNNEYQDLATCVIAALVAFSSRPTLAFVIMRHTIHDIWLVLPWTQYRSAPNEHPCRSSTIVFHGNLFELRQVAKSFPPDLFDHPVFADIEQSENDAALLAGETVSADADAKIGLNATTASAPGLGARELAARDNANGDNTDGSKDA